MKVGCFAIVDPFALLEHQLGRIRDMGFRYADVTDNHSGGLLGREFGFASTVSLDDNPLDIQRLFESYGLTITSFCAHANLLDPSSPARYATNEIMKAVRQAAALGVKHVITTEGDPKSEWGHKLTHDQRVFVTAEKLYEPLRLANDLGVYLLLEPHGILTDSITGIQDIMAALGEPENLGVNLDTGNSWIGGADPVEMAKVFKHKIMHVHWKDLGPEWEPKRGTTYGMGFSGIPVGTGVIDIKGVYAVLQDAPCLEYSTLEVGGEENLKQSYAYLKSLGAE